MNTAPQAIRPEVAVNFALTWDARVSTRNLTPSDFSSPRDKLRMLEIRAGADAVMIGRATLEIDNTDLLAPKGLPGGTSSPIRVIVTNSGKLGVDLALFRNTESPILVFSTEQMPPESRLALNGRARLYLTGEPVVNLTKLLETLWREWSVRRLVCEGGPTLFRSLLELDLVDEINVTFCPLIFGGNESPTLTGPAGAFLADSKKCRLLEIESIGGECFARYRVLRDQ